jgi:hypothetical protein
MFRSVPSARNPSVLNDAFIAGRQPSLVGGASTSPWRKILLLPPYRQTQPGRVDFELDGIPYRAFKQNPQAKSGCAELARQG